MKQAFFKYQGTGNDFVIVDNRLKTFPKENHKLIAKLCDRKFGIGADGFMLLENSDTSDFKMIYHNADGKLGSMCGNGGRCIVAFANFLGVFNDRVSFEANEKLYHATYNNENVSLKMNDVHKVEVFSNHVFLDTGSPHHVTFVNNINNFNVFEEGKKIRNGAPYFDKGTNVNFVEQINTNTFKVRTFERGVEDETLSCGTGVTAVALASFHTKKTKDNSIKLQTMGGDLTVSFDFENDIYKHIILSGPATFVFEGVIEI